MDKELARIKLIELELFSYCNRKCSWCPNSFIDRTHNKFLDNNILIKLLQELKDQECTCALTFSRYNEPMAFPFIFDEKLCLIKKYLPNCKLITNTNGDFLSESILNLLPIDELSIMDYDGLGFKKCIKRLKYLKATIDKLDHPYIYAHYRDMKILYYTNWTKHCFLSDRGGSLRDFSIEQRIPSCYEPQSFIGINYDGTVSPCCNIRNDIEKHEPYIIGDLYNNTLIEILNNPKRQEFIKNCAQACFEKDSPCYYCNNKGGRYTQGKGLEYE